MEMWTKSQFQTIIKLLEYGGWVQKMEPSEFEGVLRVSIKHSEQRDGDWTEVYLIGRDGDKIKVN